MSLEEALAKNTQAITRLTALIEGLQVPPTIVITKDPWEQRPLPVAEAPQVVTPTFTGTLVPPPTKASTKAPTKAPTIAESVAAESAAYADKYPEEVTFLAVQTKAMAIAKDPKKQEALRSVVKALGVPNIRALEKAPELLARAMELLSEVK